MAHADRKGFGPGQQDQAKGDGTGGLAPADPGTRLPQEPLSNRDTSRHSDQRGLDSAHVQNEQGRSNVDNHGPGRGEPGAVADKDKLADERPNDRKDEA
ncbi:hypothetical protein [Paracoccus rhizosphaerae]|uniref:Uncharacterized protein n=1 Tax=Paracoccus rhizosphaerae TaxID=1133347 RepID=A0ABV6CEJ9_9RHOB|nr:hypothetical protein [Paracoccus rhizosphaerae]